MSWLPALLSLFTRWVATIRPPGQSVPRVKHLDHPNQKARSFQCEISPTSFSPHTTQHLCRFLPVELEMAMNLTCT